MTKPLQELLQQDDFLTRHIGPNEQQQQEMLEALGVDNLEELVETTLPESIRFKGDLNVGAPVPEARALSELKALASKNRVTRSYIGMGYHGTLTPAVILRNILENPGWYTAYTPYQAEISQGRLEMLLNFQQVVMDLTGMEVANASLLDEATAAAEAMTLAKRVGKSKSNAFFVANDVHPQTLDVVRTRAEYFGYDVVVGDPEGELPEAFAYLMQYPGTYGVVRDLAPIVDAVHARGALAIVATDLLALTVLKSPGEMGADIVVGNSQRFGVPMGFGGPHAAFFACKDEFKRSMPGRVIGVSKDARGRTALRMAMQTREQHIRREKATSNICTAQALLANMAAAYAVYHGPQGLGTIGERVQRLTGILHKRLTNAGLRVNETFFDTLTFEASDTDAVRERALAKGINVRFDGNRVGISLDETTTPSDVTDLLEVVTGRQVEFHDDATSGIPANLVRTSPYLQHPVFNSHRSESAMLRYLKSLENKDYSLVHGMIPLGSCTMKLNATSEMLPVTWPEFANIHPFAPSDQTTGYAEMIGRLESWLADITGYDAVSMQPNSGAQGEYAGLLVIRKYHEARGEGHRDVCLIPSSAHGTNPASAAMMGMKVVVTKTDEDGNIDLADLRAKAEQHSANLAALMITYPSTHGVYEEHVKEVCDVVHRHGGQVYMDGANMNAQVGLAKPGLIGSDVSHLNLHKTFAIPHGGGGPGMGPIGVKAHLAPFLPNHAVRSLGESETGAVSAAPYGSGAILPISYLYIQMLGSKGLRRATEVAVLNANYIAKKLEGHYPVLYKGQNGRVAHECIIDIRPLKAATGITEEDIAKRLMDYGFHAPTMSFPVPGTLMIEPTESEPKEELDRFVEAMVAIRREIREVEDGLIKAEETALRHAPHTMDDLVDANWDRAYSREQAVFPTGHTRTAKYWPAVNRVDNVYGDRNFFCSCPPIEEYAELEFSQ
ncbi:aminomethyl-transferring glycine dehydrogenase [Deinococcus yavapaiensis]|uniref:Glycine dehydrogenase (decarboxylating) n=1 Tax=Deinococcus yavapaiensis KR-236 TaxID=694435 RepID=A0A318SI41_9DEIO|nr:aminomethyl-transferring glycine dehydrogenase [Deinococcus yavapaiensis]PYE53656.1 glycine dehydrogenase (decarboxylating) alpha subunit /glycine dehydrogenase (decarboxylating) beta subunit [Deinococcus yavapaiensis KR-236]